MFTADDRTSDAILTVVRRVLIVILTLAVTGILIELLLIEHFEDTWQLIPLVLLGLALPALAWHVFAPSRSSARVWGILMVLCIAAGLIGFYMHYAGNVEFELEQNPSAARWMLFREAMMGATPALAPGAMIQIGLIGLLYRFVSRKTQR